MIFRGEKNKCFLNKKNKTDLSPFTLLKSAILNKIISSLVKNMESIDTLSLIQSLY